MMCVRACACVRACVCARVCVCVWRGEGVCMLKGTANSIQKSFDYEWCPWNCDFAISQVSLGITLTPDRWQSKLLLTIDEHGPNIARNSVFDWQMTIENPVSNCFWSTFVDSINVFDCRLSGVTLKLEMTPIFQ